MTSYLHQSQLYKYHVANLRSIEVALNDTALSARRSIAKSNKAATDSFTRLFAFLLGAWAETRLNKLINENAAFTVADKLKISSESSQLDQWLMAVEVSFRAHYSIPRAALGIGNLPHSAYSRYQSIRDIIENDLRSVIEVRNKLAHGQWIYPLNNAGTAVESEKYRLINQENLLSFQFKHSLIISLADIIHNLAVSMPAFQRDFDTLYTRIIGVQTNLRKRSFAKYEQSLKDRLRRGVERRNID